MEKPLTTSRVGLPPLTSREREILSAVVQQFVLTATPVGSRQLARRHDFGLSPATVRNVMADLEEMGLLYHPHTSAGRVPSDLGYRIYVNDLMESSDLPAAEADAIEREFDGISQEMDEIMAVTARVLASASRLLAVVMAPALDDAVLHRLDLVRLSERRIAVIIALESGPVRTIMVELEQVISDPELQRLTQALNSRLSGLTLARLRAEIGERISDLPDTHPALVRFFVDSAERMFSFVEHDEMKIVGRAEVLSQPEFSEPRSMRGIIELIEDRDIIVHLLQHQPESEGVSFSIGTENPDWRAKDLSVLTCSYWTNTRTGTLGVIGPTRMNYPRLKSLMEFTVRTIGKHLESGSPIRRTKD